jgi:tRNA pseudouridine13 synthase
MVRFRATPEDFDVTELPLYEAAGAGDHLYLWIEKRDRTTEQVAAMLARGAGVPARDVGYAGRKDRRAVARQWFSVPARPGASEPDLSVEGIRVLASSRHRNKLRTGHLAGNRFRLRLLEVGASEAAAASARLGAFERYGFANRFGAQRFGRAGDNARAGELVWREGAGRNRRTARFLLSALQSEVFNEVLSARGEIAPGAGPEPGKRAIDRLVPGDVAVVHASGGSFLVEDADHEQARADALEISPSGPIFGDRMREAGGAVAELERRALDRRGIDPRRRVGGGVRVPGTRRSLRARVLQPRLTISSSGEALLEVTLEPGVYATVLLAELFAGEPLIEGSEREAGATE